MKRPRQEIDAASRFALKAIAVMLITAAAVFATNRHALLIGANNGGPGLERLRYAESDAERFAEVLRTIGDFPSSQIKILRQPDSAALGRELAALKRTIAASSARGGETMLLLYYSGHADGESLLLGRTKYPLSAIKTFLDSSGASLRVGIFDACHSGSVTALKGGRAVRAVEPFYIRGGESVRGQVIIASSAARQASQESDALRGGVFTHHWLNGLRGSADVSGSRHVTLHDAYQYAYRKTIESSALTGAGAQYPSYNFNIRGDGDIRLTNLNRSPAGLLFDRTCEGSFIISAERGTGIVADFAKRKGTEKFISVPPGRYRIINTLSGGVMTLDATVRPNTVESITASAFDTRVASAAAVRFRGAEPPPRRYETVTRKGLGGGVGAGVVTSYPVEQNGQLTITGAGVYNVAHDLQLFANLQSRPFGKEVVVDGGINFLWDADAYKIYAGAGPQLSYDYRIDTINYAMKTQIGFTAVRNERTNISAQIPVILSLTGSNHIKTGLEIMLTFWRK